MEVNTTAAVIEKYDSMQNIVSYTNMKNSADYSLYQYIERNSSGGYNYINYLGEDYIMVELDGRTYLSYSTGGSLKQLYTIFAFKEDYDDIFAGSYLLDAVEDKYYDELIEKYIPKNKNTYSFSIDTDVGPTFAEEYAEAYEITSMDKLRESYVVDSQLNLRSISLSVIPESGMPTEIMNTSRLYNIKLDIPQFARELSEPADPVKVTIYGGTAENPLKEEIYVQSGTYLGFHYLVKQIYTDENYRSLYSPGAPVKAPLSIYIKPEE